MSSSLAISLLLLLIAFPARAEKPASAWTLEEKVGQLLWPVLDERKSADLESASRNGMVGGGLLRWNMPRVTAKRFIKTLRVWSASTKGGPPLIAVDHEGGSVFTQGTLGVPIFSGNMALGAAGSVGLAEKAAAAMGKELREIGVDVNFGPVIDVNSDPKNPIIGVRSFGEAPTSVAALGAAAVRGYLKGGVLPAAKHFPGHGNTSVDSHTDLPVVNHDRSMWNKSDLPPYRAAIREHLPIVMTAHVSAPALGTGGLPATLSSAAITGILRGSLEFKGLVVSDSLDMGALKQKFGREEIAVRALNAGCDALLIGRAPIAEVHASIVRAVRDGRVSQDRIDDAWNKVLSLNGRWLKSL
jgi:beta-N-acetylhexosaminidase